MNMGVSLGAVDGADAGGLPVLKGHLSSVVSLPNRSPKD